MANSQPIGLIAAMPEEIAPLLQRFDHVSQEKLGIFTLYRLLCHGRAINVIRSGIGADNAANATAALINLEKPEFIVNFGFAGAVVQGLRSGDLVIAEKVLLHRERLFSEQSGVDLGLLKRIKRVLQEKPPATAAFITTRGVKSKKELAGLLPDGTITPVIEMETAAVLKVAVREGVPLVALRAISDDAAEELGFSVDDFTDRNLQSILLHKVIWTVGRKPWLIPQLLRLARNSKMAGEVLAAAIVQIITRI